MAMTSHQPLDMKINGPQDQTAEPTLLHVNDVFPRIDLTNENGQNITLHSENNRPKLIVFYRGSFCNYCEESLLEINKLVETFYHQKIDVICVSADGPEESKELSQRLGLRFPIGCGLTVPQMEQIGLYIHTRDPETSPKYAYCNQRLRNQPNLNVANWRKPFCEPASFLIRNNNTIKTASQPEALYHL